MPRAQTSRNSSGKAKPPKTAPSTGGGVMRMTIYFHQAEWDALQARAAKEDTTLAALVRKAVRAEMNLG